MAYGFYDNFAPAYGYVFGTVVLGLGLNAARAPFRELPRFGFPYETKTTDKSQGRLGGVSPLIYIKSNREVSYGLMLIALQYQGNEAAVATVAALVGAVALNDALVIWLHTSDELRHKAWGHGIFGVVFLAWAAAKRGFT